MMLKLSLTIAGDLERVQRREIHGLDSSPRGVVDSALMIIGELIARVGAPGHGGGIQRPEYDDHDGEDEDDGSHEVSPFLLTVLQLVLGY